MNYASQSVYVSNEQLVLADNPILVPLQREIQRPSHTSKGCQLRFIFALGRSIPEVEIEPEKCQSFSTTHPQLFNLRILKSIPLLFCEELTESRITNSHCLKPHSDTRILEVLRLVTLPHRHTSIEMSDFVYFSREELTHLLQCIHVFNG